MTRVRIGSRLVRLAGVLALALSSVRGAQAQPTASFASATQIPADIEALTHHFEARDPVKFLGDRAKPLKLTNVQRDSLKKLEQGLKRLRSPLLKRLERELPETLLPGQQVEIRTLPTATRTLVDSLSRATDTYGQWAWQQLDEAQQAQALELRANWKPDAYTRPDRRAYRVTKMGAPPK